MSRSVVLAFVAIALLSACSNDEPTVDADVPSSTAIATPAGPTAAEAQAGTATSEEPASMTIADVLRSDARFSRFRDVVERTESGPRTILGIWDLPARQMGDNRDGVTVFVPTDAAFEALDPAVAAVLDDPDVPNELLYDLFAHHYVHRLYPSEEFEPGDQDTWRSSVSGPVQLGVSPLTWGGHPISETDIRAANGIIHVIDGVVVPDDLAEAAATSSR